MRRWVPKAYADRPIYVFETGGSTGIPKSRINIDDFRIDYSMFSDTLNDKYFPRGANWLMLGPSGPRRLRLAVEHLAQVRGGICFCIDLDPRWVIRLIKQGQIDVLEDYKDHCIQQALTILRANHDIKCMFTTPKLLEALCEKISLKKAGITGVFCGGTEMTRQFHRFAREELLEGADFAPTYGNTLMGLACNKPFDPADDYRSSTSPAAAGRAAGGRSRASRAAGRVRPVGPREADHADQGVLRARLPRARRGHPHAARAGLSLGRRGRRPPVPQAGSQRGGRRVLDDVRRPHPPQRPASTTSKETLDCATTPPASRSPG